MALFIAVCLGAEIYLVFMKGSSQFRIEGTDAYEVAEFGSGRPVSHAFLMRGDGLNAVSLYFSSGTGSVVTVQWTLWRGLRDLPQEMTRAFEGTDRLELRPGRQWKTFPFTRDASSRDRWYTFEVRLLEADNVAVRSDAGARQVVLVASRDNPERGGILWIGDDRQPGSLFIRAERQGRTPYRRFVAEIEPNLPRALRIPAVQWAIAITFHWAIFVVALAIIRDAARSPQARSPQARSPQARKPADAFPVVAEGLSRIFDAAGLLLLTWLGWRMFFDFDSNLQGDALVVAVIGIIAGAADGRAARNVPVAMLAYVGIALLSAGVHRWGIVSASEDLGWLSLFRPASHLVVMAAFVYGAAYLLRTPLRLSWFVILMMFATFVLSAQIAFDRASTGFVYVRSGPSLASVPQWSGIHGTSLALTLGLALASAGLALRRSVWLAMASAILAVGLFAVAYVNGSRGGLVAMGVVAGSIALFAVLEATGRRRPTALVVSSVATLAGVLVLVVWFLRGYFNNGADLSGRTLIWQAAARLIAEHPWLGVGPGNYGQALVASGYAADFPYYLSLNNAHNLLLQASVEAGVIGGLCLLLFLAWALQACWRAWSTGYVPMVSLGILLALAGFMVHSLSENYFNARDAVERTRLIVWMILAASLALDRLPRQLAQSPISDS